MQKALAQIPWYHHIALLEKLDSSAERLWYARQAMEHGWSHNILIPQIQSALTSKLRANPEELGYCEYEKEPEMKHAART